MLSASNCTSTDQISCFQPPQTRVFHDSTPFNTESRRHVYSGVFGVLRRSDQAGRFTRAPEFRSTFSGSVNFPPVPRVPVGVPLVHQ